MTQTRPARDDRAKPSSPREILVLADDTRLADTLARRLQRADRKVSIDQIRSTHAPCSADYLIVVQSTSTSPDLVMTDARIQRARASGALVVASLDKAGLTILAGEAHLDLSGWRGGPRHPALLQLIEVVDKGAGPPTLTPPADAWKALRTQWATTALQATWRASVERLGAPRSRKLFKFATGIGTIFVALSGAYALVKANETKICKVSFAQPAISDACGAVGFGGRPTRAEREGWQAAKLSCDGLRLYLRSPEAPYHDEAMTLLASRQVKERQRWVPTERPLALFSDTTSPQASEELARSKVLAAAQVKAIRQCQGFLAIGGFKFKSATVKPLQWTCGPAPGGTRCQMEGETTCALDELKVETEEDCAKPAREA